MSDSSVATADPPADFCPECGQSLRFSRPRGDIPGRRTAEPWLLALVGLCLAVVCGARSWQAHGALAGLDRQIAVGRTALTHDVFGVASKQATVQAEALTTLLMDRASMQQRVARDRTGLALGLIGLAAGVGAPIRSVLGLAARRRRGHAGIDGPPSPGNALVRIAVGLGAMGNALASALFRVLLIVFGGGIAAQLLRGVPPTLDVVDQALARTLDVVTAIGGMLG